MRIALAQINPTVGDLRANVRKILDFISRAKAQQAQLVVFPELSITGYPPKDLLLKPQFVNDNLRALRLIASKVHGIDAIVGYAEPNANPVGRSLHNAVALLRDGQVVSKHFKTLLPTYDVFDESRYFEPGPKTERTNLVQIADVTAGLSICEDLWNDEKMIPRRLYHQNPIADLHAAGAQVLINTSASPFVVGKHEFRLQLFSSQVKQFGQPLVYVNQVGGNDELVFDGNSVVFDAAGNVIAQARDFEEDLLVVDLRATGGMGVSPMLAPRATDVPPVDRGIGVSPMLAPHTTGVPPAVRGMGVSPMLSPRVTGVPPVDRGMGVSPMLRASDAPEIRFAPDNLPQVVSARQGANLPHWTLEGAAYALTFRLIDAMPQTVLNQWLAERTDIQERAATMGRPLSESETHRLEELHAQKIQQYLDAGYGECLIRDERIAHLVSGALLQFDHQRYEMLAWCLMPNHVHVVVQPRPGHTLHSILHSWKSFTAHRANEMLSRTGEIWQPESYDHLIRDREELRHCVRYLWNNPGEAGLGGWNWRGVREDLVDSLEGAEAKMDREEHGRDAHGTGEPHGRDAHGTGEPHGRDAHATGGPHGRDAHATGEQHERDAHGTGEPHGRDAHATGGPHGRDAHATGGPHGRDAHATGEQHGRDAHATGGEHGRDAHATGEQHGRDAHATIPSSGVESIRRALVLGLRDYCQKCGFKTVVLGLSGGIDSALTAVLAVQALGPDKVVGVAMPSRYSSEHSVADAKALAQNLQIQFHIVPIKEIHDAYEHTLAPAFEGRTRDVTEENLQARARGGVLMAFSNKFNHLLLTTGNKSELAVGYCTLYGDMCGGLAVISDVPKTTVYELCEHINQLAGRELIPRNTITKPPSAELRANQTDQDSLPEYAILDAILYRYVEEEKGAAQIIAEGFDPATVLRVIKLIDRSEYKRRQAAPGIKVTSRAFGFGRRMPIAQNYAQVIPKDAGPQGVQEGSDHGWGYEPEND